MNEKINETIYDVIIIGGGPAGMTAGIYAAHARLKTLMVEKYVYGGQIANTNEVSNYPGFENIPGAELADRMKNHALSFGMETINDNVVNFDFKEEIKTIETQYSGVFKAKSIILCMGASARKLGTKNEERFTGSGVCYCAICDGALYKDKAVAVVGGGDSAMEDAVYLQSFAKKVYLIHRRGEFRAQQLLQDNVAQLAEEGKIELLLNSEVVEVTGEKNVKGIKLKNLQTGDVKDIELDGLFIAVGREPDTLGFDAIEKDDKGYILTNESMETNIKGVYAAGDVRKKELRQIVTATSDGAIAAVKANIYLKSLKRK